MRVQRDAGEKRGLGQKCIWRLQYITNKPTYPNRIIFEFILIYLYVDLFIYTKSLSQLGKVDGIIKGSCSKCGSDDSLNSESGTRLNFDEFLSG